MDQWTRFLNGATRLRSTHTHRIQSIYIWQETKNDLKVYLSLYLSLRVLCRRVSSTGLLQTPQVQGG